MINIIGIAKAANRSPPMPQRSPPPPPSSGGGGQLGAFWSTPHAKDSLFVEDKSRPKFDEEPSHNTSQQDRNQSENRSFPKNASPAKQENVHNIVAGRRNVHNKSHVPEDGASKDFELTFSQKVMDHGMERPKASKPAATHLFQDEAFSTFVAEFDSNKLNSRVSNDKEGKEEALEAEIERLKEQLKQVNSEKAEITSKFEKLSAICRSQRQEIQELKQTLAARTPSPNKYQASSRIQPSASPPVLFSLMFSPL
jgi:AP2-associated kinase